MNRNKQPINMRLSERTRLLLTALAEKHDITQTAVVEMAVRDLAKNEGIDLVPKEKKDE